MIDYCLEKARMIPYKRGRQRIYSVITDSKNRIISESECMYFKSHPKQKEYSLRAGFNAERCMMHSELRACVLSKGKGVKITIARVAADGRPLDAVPCPSCRMCINDHGGIKEISYSTGVM